MNDGRSTTPGASLLHGRPRAEVIAALKRELTLVHDDDRAEALGPHPMVGRIDCELCGEGVCHYLHITEQEASRRVS